VQAVVESKYGWLWDSQSDVTQMENGAGECNKYPVRNSGVEVAAAVAGRQEGWKGGRFVDD